MKQLGPSGSTILGAQKQVTQWRHENIMMRWYQNQPPNNNNNISITSCLPNEWANIDVTALCKQWLGPDHPQENYVLHCRLARYKNCFDWFTMMSPSQAIDPECPPVSYVHYVVYFKNSRCRIKLFNLFILPSYAMILLWFLYEHTCSWCILLEVFGEVITSIDNANSRDTSCIFTVHWKGTENRRSSKWEYDTMSGFIITLICQFTHYSLITSGYPALIVLYIILSNCYGDLLF